MAFQKPKLSLTEVSQTFDLEDLLGVDVSDRPDILVSFGQAVIDIILDRTEDGKAIGGKRNLKKPYSKEYAASDNFAAFGKSKNEINMTLRGTMLNDLDILKMEGSKVTVGFKDELQIKKAFNHNTGDRIGKENKRPFFGVRKGEISDEISEFKESSTRQETQEQAVVNDAIELLENRQIAEDITETLFADLIGDILGES